MINVDKTLLRKYHKTLRSVIPERTKSEYDAKIFDLIINSENYIAAAGVFTYASHGLEVDTMKLIGRALSDGKQVAVPRCTGAGQMSFHAISSLSELMPGSYGIPEPSEKLSVITPVLGDVFIVPALSADYYGVRLGYGGGYYDRYLAEYPDALTLCPCYAAELTETLPSDRHDIHMKYIITENNIWEAANEH